MMLRSIGIAILCGVVVSCSTGQNSPQAAATAELSVQQASDLFWATRERGDAQALAAQFTEEARYGVPGLADAEGRTEIAEMLKGRLAAVRSSDFKIRRREIEVCGDSAYELGWFSEISRAGDADSMRMEGRYVIAWKRGVDDVWRVHRTSYNFSRATPAG